MHPPWWALLRAMLPRSSIFPGQPERDRPAVRRAAPRRPVLTPGVYQLIHEAEWLSEMWSEFPVVGMHHQSYARAFRRILAAAWFTPSGAGRARRLRVRIRRLAWRAYWRAVANMDPPGNTSLSIHIQRLKVDSYWARRLWTMIGGDSVHLSILKARDFELQQICNSLPPPSPAPLSLTRILAHMRGAAPR